MDVGDSGEDVESMDGTHSEEIKEMKRKYPKISPQKVDTYSSMVGEDLQNLFKVSEESFPNAPGKDLDVDDNSDNFAKKAKAIDKMLVAKAKKNGIMIPPLEDRIKAANEERKKWRLIF